MGLLENIKNQQQAAMNDYSRLLGFYPNAEKFANGLLLSIDEVLPKAADYDVKNHPERMRDWSLGVFSGQYGIPVNNLRSGMLK